MGALHKILYQLGFTQYGMRLLAELDPGSPEWFEFVEALFERNDIEARSLALDQIKEPGFYRESDQKERIKALALRSLTKGSGDEKRTALAFFSENRDQFTKDDADVFSAVYSSTRASDRQVSSLAEELLTHWGFDRDSLKSDKELR